MPSNPHGSVHIWEWGFKTLKVVGLWWAGFSTMNFTVASGPFS